MGFKMAPSDHTKVALGVLTLASIGIALYFIRKQWQKRNNANDDSSKEKLSPPIHTAEKISSHLEASKQPRIPSEETASESETLSGKQSLLEIKPEPTSISVSLSSWEEVNPITESFTEVQNVSDSFAGIPSGGGDMVSSLNTSDSSHMKLDSGKESISSCGGEFEISGETFDRGDAGTAAERLKLRLDEDDGCHGNLQKEVAHLPQCGEEASSGEPFEQITDAGEVARIQSEPRNDAESGQSARQLSPDGTSTVADTSHQSFTTSEEIGEAGSDKQSQDLKAEGVGAGALQKTHSSSSSEGEGSNKSSGSFEMVKTGLGSSGQEFYSSESLQSFATAMSGAASSQDFYSPVSSPQTVDSSLDNVSFHSFDNTTTGSSPEVSFYDVDNAGGESPHQDVTPTNTPPPSDDESLQAALSERMASSQAMEESLTPVVAAQVTTVAGPEEEASRAAEESSSAAPSTSSPDSGSRVFDIDKDKMTAAIMQAQTNPALLDLDQLQILLELLKQDDRPLLSTALQSIIRASAFTDKVNVLRVCGAPQELSRLLHKFAALLLEEGEAESGAEGTPTVKTLFLNTARAVNNLAMDIKSQPPLEGTIPMLTDLLMTDGISESVTLACLQPLTNLSSSPAYHGHYTRLLQQLYSFLDTSHSPHLRLQCLKLLVNLSLNADMVPHMLAAKAPSCLLDLLDVNYDVDLLLRTVTFLANVMTIKEERGLSPSSLPPDEKAPSPETLYSALVAHDRRDALRNKIYRLTRHDSEDICYQASRLYKCVVSSK